MYAWSVTTTVSADFKVLKNYSPLLQVLPANRGATEWNLHVVRTAEATGLSGKDGLFKVAAATYRPRRGRADDAADGSSAAGAALDADGLLGGEDRSLGAAGEMAAALAGATEPALQWHGAEGAWDGAAPVAGNGDSAGARPRPGGEGGSRMVAANDEGSDGASNGGAGRRQGAAGSRKDIPVAGNIREEIDGW